MCVSPVSIKYVDYLGRDCSIAVGCGKCVECQRKVQNDWKIRLIEEFKDWQYCYFLTLTYRPASLPMVKAYDTGEMLSTTSKSDIQGWIKRFRTRYIRKKAKELGVTVRDINKSANRKYSCKLKYFFCAEYGPNGTKRPHYHGIIFCDLPKNQLNMLIADWRKKHGFVQWSRVKKYNYKNPDNPLSAPANYVAKYCCKLQFSSRKDDLDKCRIGKEFRLMSKNIGLGYVDRLKDYHKPNKLPHESRSEYVERIYSRLRYNDNGYKFSLPRYYRSHIFYDKVDKLRKKWDEKNKTFYLQKVRVLAPHNQLCTQMQYYIQHLNKLRFDERYEIIKSENTHFTDSEICSAIADVERHCRDSRARVQYSKLANFYYQNKLKNKQL